MDRERVVPRGWMVGPETLTRSGGPASCCERRAAACPRPPAKLRRSSSRPSRHCLCMTLEHCFDYLCRRVREPSLARARTRASEPRTTSNPSNPCRIPVVIHPARVQRAHARIRQKNFILDQSTLRPGCRTDPRRILTAFSSLTACACSSSPLPMRSSPRPSPARN